MAENRAEKWSSKKRMLMSILILAAVAAGFIALYYIFNDKQEEQLQVQQAEKSLSAEEKAESLIAQLYTDETKSEMKLDVEDGIYEEINEQIDRIEDINIQYDLNVEVAEAIMLLYTQLDIRDALEDEGLLNEMTAKNIAEIEESIIYAEEVNPNFTENIKPEFEELKKRFETLQ